MFPPTFTKAQHLTLLEGMSDLEFARFRYCQEMAGTYLAIGKLEDMLISAMHMCDRVKLKKALGADLDRWSQSLEKKARLQSSTLGSLIKILESHPVVPEDIAYLRWVKDKRDYFIHRLFHEGAWPGLLDVDDCRAMTRRLLAIQLLLARAERNIWSIFERADFVALQRFDEGTLVMNAGMEDLLTAMRDD